MSKAITKIYVNLIEHGLKTIDDVPGYDKEEVRKLLDEKKASEQVDNTQTEED